MSRSKAGACETRLRANFFLALSNTATFRQVPGSTETGNQGHPKKANAPSPKPQTVALTLAKTPPSTVYRSNRDKGRDVEAALRASQEQPNHCCDDRDTDLLLRRDGLSPLRPQGLQQENYSAPFKQRNQESLQHIYSWGGSYNCLNMQRHEAAWPSEK